MLIRNSEWALRFLDLWYAHPAVEQGAPDQYVFDRLWEENAMDVQRHLALLPVRSKTKKRVILEQADPCRMKCPDGNLSTSFLRFN